MVLHTTLGECQGTMKSLYFAGDLYPSPPSFVLLFPYSLSFRNIVEVYLSHLDFELNDRDTYPGCLVVLSSGC